MTEYRLQKWSRSGKLLKTLTRQESWFQPWIRYPVGPVTTPPYGAATWLDERGRIWTMTVVPSAEQDRQRNKVSQLREQRAGEEWKDQQKAFDTMVEVIDPRTERLVFSRRIDQKIVAGLSGGFFASFRQAEDGVAYFDIWRFRLVEG